MFVIILPGTEEVARFNELLAELRDRLIPFLDWGIGSETAGPAVAR